MLAMFLRHALPMTLPLRVALEQRHNALLLCEFTLGGRGGGRGEEKPSVEKVQHHG